MRALAPERFWTAKKICDSPLTSGTAALFCEFRETRTGPCVEPVFFRAQGRADLGQINDEGRVCLVLKEVAIFDSLAPNAFGVEIVSKH